MTYCLFIDEKGPQSKTRFQNKMTSRIDNDPSRKIKMADDKMFTYFAIGFLIEKERLQDFENDFEKIEEYYRSCFFKNKNTSAELKGAKILKKKTLKGFTGLTTNIAKFYNELFELVHKYDGKLCVLTESKIENIIEDVFNNTVFDKGVNHFIRKLNGPDALKNSVKISAIYSLTKSFADEPSGNFVNVLNSDSFSIDEAFTAMANDLQDRIKDFSQEMNDPSSKDDPQRVSGQIEAYKQLIDILENSIHQQSTLSEILLSDNIGNFDWKKIIKQLCSFLIENKISFDNILLYLDEGIKKETFDSMHLQGIYENINSKNCPGIRICDFMVTLIGSIATYLSKDTRYNTQNSLERTLIPSEYFQFTNRNRQFENGQNHFELIRSLNSNLNKDLKYYGNIFNDDLLIFQCYVNVLSEFKTFNDLTNKYTEKDLQNMTCAEFVRLANEQFHNFGYNNYEN